jgi:nucleolin
VAGVRIALGQDGRPRGFAHVEFADASAVPKAVEMNGADMGGRNIRVDASAGRAGGGGGGGGGGFNSNRGGPQEDDGGTSVFVKGFDKYLDGGEDAVRAALTEAFGGEAKVAGVRLPSDRETGELKGFAFIEFVDNATKQEAASMDGAEVAGGWLKVDANPGARPPAGGGGGGFGGGGRGGGRGGGFGGGGRGGGGFGGRGGGRGFGGRDGGRGGRGGFGGRDGGRGGRGGGRGFGGGGRGGGMRIDAGAGGAGKKTTFDD